MYAIAWAILTKKFVVASEILLGVVALTVDPTAFAAAAVLIIGAIGGAAVLIINALGKMKTDILDKQAILDKKVEIVQGHVDGMTTAAAAKRTADEDTILSLRDQLNKSEARAERLAQTTASATVAAASQTPVAATVSTSATQSLDNIDASTKAIDVNTKRTRDDVQDLKEK